MRSVQQRYQTGNALTRPFRHPSFSKTPIHIAITQCVVFNKSIRQVHSMIEDRTYRSVLVSYTILRVIRNSLISRVHPSLMLLNISYRVVVACIATI